MTIDSPYLCLLGVGVRLRPAGGAVGRARPWAAAGRSPRSACWPSTPCSLFPACVGLFLLTDRTRRGEFRRPGFWVMAALTAAGAAPDHGLERGARLGELPARLALAGADTRQAASTRSGPAALPGRPVRAADRLLVRGLGRGGRGASGPGGAADPRTAFLWWASVPVLAVFLLAAVKSKGQAELAGRGLRHRCVLAVAWVARQVTDPRRGYRRLARACPGARDRLRGVGDARRPATRGWSGRSRRVMPAPTADRPVPIRKLDPTSPAARLAVARRRGGRIRERVRAEKGRNRSWSAMTGPARANSASTAAVNPTVYTFGPALADRHSQYDVWRPNPVADAQVFRGRTFVYVGDSKPGLQQAFDRVDSPVEVIASDGGIPVADWKVWVLRGFRGFPDGRRAPGTEAPCTQRTVPRPGSPGRGLR